MATLGFNAAAAVTQSLTGVRLDPYMAFNFVIEVEGLLAGGFNEVSGLESRVEVEEYREGGVNAYVHKLPGPVSYENLVLSQGLTGIDIMWDWYVAVTEGNVQRKNITLMLLDRERLPAMWWDFSQAYPVQWTGPTFHASQSAEVAVERIELAHDGFTKPPASQTLARGRLGLQLGNLPVSFPGF